MLKDIDSFLATNSPFLSYDSKILYFIRYKAEYETRYAPKETNRGNKKTVVKEKTQPNDYSKFGIIAILITTFICFYPVLAADFVNWDDPKDVLGNKMIMELSFENIKEIFSTFLMGNYHPLPVLEVMP